MGKIFILLHQPFATTVTQGARHRRRALRGRALRPWLRLAAEAHVWRLGRDANDSDDRSLWIVGGHLGGDLRLGPATRLTAGVLYTNADTRATAIETDADGLSRRVRVRSHDWWPTLDVIWAF